MISFNFFLAATGAIVAITAGLLLSLIPRNLGLYRWHAYRQSNAFYVGRIPAAHHGVVWKFTFEDLSSYNLTGQTALVTGSNSGIGYEIALRLARQGANVHVVCRNASKCNTAAKAFQSDLDFGGGFVSTWTMDTSSLESVKKFSDEFILAHGTESLDMLFLNAGIGSSTDFSGEGKLPLSKDGIELMFATNHLGHHLLYKMLTPALQKSNLARVVLTTSGANMKSFDYGVATDLKTLNGVDSKKDMMKIYAQSKLCQILWAKKLTRDLGPNSSVFVNAAHPGAVDTNIFDKSLQGWRWRPILLHIIHYLQKNVFWSSAEGALTLLYLGVATDQLINKNIRGKYFHPQSYEVAPNPLALDRELQNDLWTFSDDLVKDFF